MPLSVMHVSCLLICVVHVSHLSPWDKTPAETGTGIREKQAGWMLLLLAKQLITFTVGKAVAAASREIYLSMCLLHIAKYEGLCLQSQHICVSVWALPELCFTAADVLMGHWAYALDVVYKTVLLLG